MPLAVGPEGGCLSPEGQTELFGLPGLCVDLRLKAAARGPSRAARDWRVNT